ncbi:MAG: hypothetical protein U0R76_00100, partial [Candidatus Nanopelagicales bacterium]
MSEQPPASPSSDGGRGVGADARGPRRRSSGRGRTAGKPRSGQDGPAGKPRPSVPDGPEVLALRQRLEHVMLRDRTRLGRRLDGLRRTPDPQQRASAIEKLTGEVAAAEARIAARRGGVPTIT